MIRSIDLFRSSKSKPSIPETDPTPQNEPKVILAVIGSSQVQSAIEQSLESIFIEMVIVGSGEAAIEYLDKNFVSLLISEINLPLMSGLNLLRKIKESETLRDIPVLLISDSGDGPDKVMGTETGADDYVTLPINPSELKSRVMALMSRRDATQTGTNLETEETEIFEEGILNSGRGAGVDTIPEDEIGLGESEKITADVSNSTEEIDEVVIESPPETLPQPVEEEAIPVSEPESQTAEEMLNPTLPPETTSSNPLRPGVDRSGRDVEDSNRMISQEDYKAQESSDSSISADSIQVNESDELESEPDLVSTENAEMLDDIFGSGSSKKPIPSVDETESRPEQHELNSLPSSAPIDSREFAVPSEQPPLPPPVEEIANPVPPAPILVPAAQPPPTAVQVEEPVQQPPAIPTAAPINTQETIVVPADSAKIAATVEPPVQSPATEGTVQGTEPIASGVAEPFNEFEIDTAVDHKEIYRSTISHLIELESTVMEGADYNFSDIVQNAGKIVASLRQSNYLQIRAMGKRDGGDFPIHSINVTIYCVKLAIGLKYETKKLIELAVAALLHDVGMLLIPKEIRHAQRKLSTEEISTLKIHPQYGSEFLTKAVQTHPELSAFTFVPIVALQEHERMNGTGYPNSIPGDEIHEYAKIISIIDMYEAVSHPSKYRDEYLAYEALQKVVALKDSHFDVKLLRALVREISIFPIDSVVRLNDGQIGKVIGLEPSHPMRPKLLLLYDADGNYYEEKKELELSKSPFLYVEVPISEEDMEKLEN